VPKKIHDKYTINLLQHKKREIRRGLSPKNGQSERFNEKSLMYFLDPYDFLGNFFKITFKNLILHVCYYSKLFSFIYLSPLGLNRKKIVLFIAKSSEALLKNYELSAILDIRNLGFVEIVFGLRRTLPNYSYPALLQSQLYQPYLDTAFSAVVKYMPNFRIFVNMKKTEVHLSTGKLFAWNSASLLQHCCSHRH
jgi:hypothetical protein